MKTPTFEEFLKEQETKKTVITAAELTNAAASVTASEKFRPLILNDPSLMLTLPLFTAALKMKIFEKESKPEKKVEPHYTIKEISDGMECWLNPDNEVFCEDCAFSKESNHNGACKFAVLRELRKILGKPNEVKNNEV